MEADQDGRRGNAPDDIMLSSAEDLNIDGSFMGGDASGGRTRDDDLSDAVADVLNSSEPENAQIDPEDEDMPELRERVRDHVRRPMDFKRSMEFKRPAESHKPVEKPVVMMPEGRSGEDLRQMRELREPTKKPCPMERKEACIVTAEQYRGINKMALAWMVVLTIILGGVVGIMIYAFILHQTGNDTVSHEPAPDVTVQENVSAVAGALEIYLSSVNLDNYNTDLVLVNGGGTVTLSGTLKHTVYVNSTSAVTLVLNGVTIESETNAAVVNLGKSEMAVRVDGINTLLGAGGKYGAALYSAGPMEIRGDGRLMVYSSGNGSRGITSANGYKINGGSVVVLAQAATERPAEDSAQAYFAKELAQVYRAGTLISAEDEREVEVAKFTAPGDFSSIFVSNHQLKDGVQYSISLGSVENKE